MGLRCQSLFIVNKYYYYSRNNLIYHPNKQKQKLSRSPADSNRFPSATGSGIRSTSLPVGQAGLRWLA